MAAPDLPHYTAAALDSGCDGCGTSGNWIFFYEQLKHAAETGCPQCALIMQCADCISGKDLNEFYLTDRALAERGVMNLDKRSKMEIFTLSGSPRCSLPYVGIRNATSDRFGNEYYPILSRWLEDCASNHACAPSKAPLPSRVLDLGLGSSTTIRLCETNREASRYIVLSHCWGVQGPEQFCTTGKNNLQRLQGFSLPDMPKSYRGVISIANHLGIRYVWIDSLCIIQDDRSDWGIQSSVMAAIYQDAFLVVGAACAEDSRKGFIASRGYKPFVRVATMQNYDGSISSICARRQDKYDEICRTSDWDLRKSPLESRAWALQERILSRRMVRFEEYEMVWECRSSVKCECQDFNQDERHHVKSGWEIALSKGWLDAWQELVNEYHHCAITYPSDFLPALSGIVTQLQAFGAGEYLAGLWAKMLSEELLWKIKTKPSSTPYVRARPYRAPTWSWASLHLPAKEMKHWEDIDFCSGDASDTSPFLRVVGASCTPSGHNKNGAVLSGELVVEAILLRVPFNSPKDFERFVRPLAKRSPLSMLRYIYHNANTSPISFDVPEFSSKPDLYAIVNRIMFDGLQVSLKGLVLCPVDYGKMVFERVGVWEEEARADAGERYRHVQDEVRRELDGLERLVVTII